MVERAGCVTGPRGFGPRKFKGIMYDPYKVYLSKQCDSFNHEIQKQYDLESLAQAEQDRATLVSAGKIAKLVKKNLGSILVLYIRRVEV